VGQLFGLLSRAADRTHFAQWCAAHGFAPLPAVPETVGAYLAGLAGAHAPTTIPCNFCPCHEGVKHRTIQYSNDRIEDDHRGALVRGATVHPL
jgi:hypothetical protein